MRLHGPFQGVISFSQGSALTALIVLRAAIQKLKDRNVQLDEKTLARFNEMDIRFPKELMSFDFAILFSGFRSHSSRHSSIYEVKMNSYLVSNKDFNIYPFLACFMTLRCICISR